LELELESGTDLAVNGINGGNKASEFVEVVRGKGLAELSGFRREHGNALLI
jgi:hypothetical protein